MLNYNIIGEGEQTWVFLHGFLESSSMWKYVDLNIFSGRKILIDLPGHGKSGLNASLESASMTFFAEEVEKVLKNESVLDCRIIGHSMGAYVGVEVMHRKQIEVNKMVFLNSNCWADSEQKKIDRQRVAKIVFKAKHVFINEAIPNLFAKTENFQNDITALKNEALQIKSESIAFAALSMKDRDDYCAFVQSFPEKFAFIHGDLDRLVSTEDLISKVGNAKVFVIEKAGHMVHIEAKEQLLEIFLKLC
jgi:pimeloyl-ACP methyl ester carboxylesterase